MDPKKWDLMESVLLFAYYPICLNSIRVRKEKVQICEWQSTNRLTNELPTKHILMTAYLLHSYISEVHKDFHYHCITFPCLWQVFKETHEWIKRLSLRTKPFKQMCSRSVNSVWVLTITRVRHAVCRNLCVYKSLYFFTKDLRDRLKFLISSLRLKLSILRGNLWNTIFIQIQIELHWRLHSDCILSYLMYTHHVGEIMFSYISHPWAIWLNSLRLLRCLKFTPSKLSVSKYMKSVCFVGKVIFTVHYCTAFRNFRDHRSILSKHKLTYV